MAVRETHVDIEYSKGHP
uniref:Uncharacterized protein n=1 Tax=Anguilla anguilla TaxID=7936 RepID=A0A0E9Q7P4_ANGAN